MGKTRKDNEFDVNVGNNLRALREKKRMTQQELANKLDVTKACVCHWESGQRALYFSIAKQICKILDCTLEDLVK